MVTPKLRFKEFNEDWSKSSIIELSKEKILIMVFLMIRIRSGKDIS